MLLIPLEDPDRPLARNYYYGQLQTARELATGDGGLNADLLQSVMQLNAGAALAETALPTGATLATLSAAGLRASGE